MKGEFVRYSRVNVGQEEIDDLKDAEILLSDNNFTAQVMFKLPKLKWIQSTRAGIEGIINEVKKHGSRPDFVMTRFSGVSFARIMTEFTLGQILNRERNFFYYFQLAKQQKLW